MNFDTNGIHFATTPLPYESFRVATLLYLSRKTNATINVINMLVIISGNDFFFVTAGVPIGLLKELVLYKDSPGFISSTRRESCGSGGFYPPRIKLILKTDKRKPLNPALGVGAVMGRN